MSSIETYEQNIDIRLEELRAGDPAYEIHRQAILEAILFSHDQHGYQHTPRILDCGCGLGFLTASFAKLGLDIEGIDPSEKNIDLARKEHENVPFWNSSAESFPQVMKDNNIELYDQAILNMVLHSVDDNTVKNILNNLKRCIRPEGALIIILPEQLWIAEKLIQYAKDQGMEKEPGIKWVEEQLEQDKITIPYKIRSGKYYPSPLTIFNRTLEEYGEMLDSEGYGVKFNHYSAETNDLICSYQVPYHCLDDYIGNVELWINTRRRLLLSFSLVD